jgi:phosphoribosylformimino-5-aminoimidazole carboxamide ribotide isomerase
MRRLRLPESIRSRLLRLRAACSIGGVKGAAEPRAKKLAGAIAGRALYDGRLDPAAALALIRNARAAA